MLSGPQNMSLIRVGPTGSSRRSIWSGVSPRIPLGCRVYFTLNILKTIYNFQYKIQYIILYVIYWKTEVELGESEWQSEAHLVRNFCPCSVIRHSMESWERPLSEYVQYTNSREVVIGEKQRGLFWLSRAILVLISLYWSLARWNPLIQIVKFW